jgi:prepilin peptidase CpaA
MLNLSTESVSMITVLTILILSAIIDLRTQKIPNIITYSSMLAALCLHTANNGMSGLIFSLKGIAAGIALLIVPYMMSGMGAGDAKLMGVVGSFLGAKATFEAFLLIGVCGGVYSVALILIRREMFKGFLSEKIVLLTSIVLLKQYKPLETKTSRQRPRIKYGVAIAFGTITYLFLKSVGIKLFV